MKKRSQQTSPGVHSSRLWLARQRHCFSGTLTQALAHSFGRREGTHFLTREALCLVFNSHFLFRDHYHFHFTELNTMVQRNQDTHCHGWWVVAFSRICFLAHPQVRHAWALDFQAGLGDSPQSWCFWRNATTTVASAGVQQHHFTSRAWLAPS